ncbi:MAG TPA: MFS transporter [Steroidobacteraceae bacterium]|nr:MFS transporter [Steroidobacteraceae bacterium]
MTPKPHLSPWQIFCVCVGAFGIQFGFALPQANATRIFENLGASLESVPLLWLAGPITGLIVQPLVGYYSDRTWTRFGRRRPYYLAGALLAACALVAMPNATTLWSAMCAYWLLDASINFTMGPYRAFVADQMPADQHATGFVMYMFFASVGAVVGSLLPWAMTHLGISTVAPDGGISFAVKVGFAVGAMFLLSAVAWAALANREYPPEVFAKYDVPPAVRPPMKSAPRMQRHALAWVGIGAAGWLLTWWSDARPALYVLVFASLAYGLFLLVASRMKSENAFTSIIDDLESMSASMRWLAVVQFCSWFSLFAIFVYTTPAVARLHFGSSQPGTPAYEAGADWVGVLFAAYNAFGAAAAFFIPPLVKRFGMRRMHQINLWIGSAGLLSMVVIRDPNWLLASMVGVGIAWASIIALPYAMLANNLPARKMGVNMGIFNIFIVIPQLLAIGVLPWLLDQLGGGDASFVFVLAAAGWLLAGLAVLRVRDAVPTSQATG